MNNNDLIYKRSTSNAELNVENRNVSGYAIVFDKWSDGLPFKEIICKGAIDEDTIKRSDVFARLNHNDDFILARSKFGQQGSLKLTIDSKGLRYSFTAPSNIYGDLLLSQIQRGEIDSSSFAFTLADGGQEIKRGENGELLHYVKKIDRLFDVSPVYQAAYSATDCFNRNVDEAEAFKKLLENKECLDKLNSIETEFLLNL